MFRFLAAVAAVIAYASPLLAQAPPARFTAGTLVIETPWMRETPDGARVAGGFMRITNTGKEPDRLLTGSAPFSKRVEVHEMRMDGGVMKMRELDKGLEIKPGETVELKPGGLHVMFMDLAEQPKAGERRKSTFVFEKAGTVEVDVSVVPRGQNAPAGKAHHH
jgi:periplasmic copper chaperone A